MDNERLLRKQHDYSNVLAGLFNDSARQQEVAIGHRKVFTEALLKINNLSRDDQLNKETVEEVTMQALAKLGYTGKKEKDPLVD